MESPRAAIPSPRLRPCGARGSSPRVPPRSGSLSPAWQGGGWPRRSPPGSTSPPVTAPPWTAGRCRPAPRPVRCGWSARARPGGVSHRASPPGRPAGYRRVPRYQTAPTPSSGARTAASSRGASRSRCALGRGCSNRHARGGCGRGAHARDPPREDPCRAGRSAWRDAVEDLAPAHRAGARPPADRGRHGAVSRRKSPRLRLPDRRRDGRDHSGGLQAKVRPGDLGPG